DRVQVDHTVKTVIALLQGHELDDGAEVVAEMQIASGLHPGKDFLFEGHHRTLLLKTASHAMPRWCRARGAHGFGMSLPLQPPRRARGLRNFGIGTLAMGDPHRQPLPAADRWL